MPEKAVSGNANDAKGVAVSCKYRVREMGSLVPAPGMTVEVAHVTCVDHADFPGWAGLAITQEVKAEDGTKAREVMSARLDLGAALLLANRLAAVVNAAAEPRRPGEHAVLMHSHPRQNRLRCGPS